MNATNERYEIITFERFTLGSRAADRSIIAGLNWDDIVIRLNKASIHPQLVLNELATGKRYHYHDHDGKLCRLTRYTV